MEPNQTLPTNITVNRETGHLVIDWSNDSHCEYPLNELREACPCAECRGGHHNMGIANAPQNLLSLTPARSYKVEDVQILGSYALQFTWDDGHHAGIYTWEYLLHLCPKIADKTAEAQQQSDN